MSLHPFNPIRPSDLFPRGILHRPFFLFDFPAETLEDQSPLLPLVGNQCDDSLARVEAVLFLSREPLSGRRLAQYAELSDGTRIRTLIKTLNQRYDARRCAFHVVEVAGGFQLRTRPHLVSWLVRWQEIPTTVQLSTPALETLAVIAYRQPIHRAGIERIRGVHCSEVIRQLLEQDLVKIIGRSEELGRPFLYGTTKNFLQVFGFSNLQELPSRELFD